MTGFLYFLPNEKPGQPHDRLLAEYGLEHICDSGDKLHVREVIRGPENMRGVLLGNDRNWTVSDVRWNEFLQYKPFAKTHAEKQAYCCYLPKALPRPEDLLRRPQLSGEFITLPDGQNWLIPYARRWDGERITTTLPRRITIDEETGEFYYGEVRDEYRAIWDHTCRYLEAACDAAANTAPGDSVRFEFTGGTEMFIDALAVNYRVSARELEILGSLSDTHLEQVAAILLAQTKRDAIEKKKAGTTGTGSSGAVDSSPEDPAITNQPSPT